MFSFPSLKKAGVLGMNSRNLDYIFAVNDRKNYPLVDDKVKTKELALARGIPVPEVYGVISYHEQIKTLEKMISAHDEFVVKPAKGSGGGGIMVLTKSLKTGYIKQSGKPVSAADLHYHIGNILGGLYALGGVRDQAIIEQRAQNTVLFEKMACSGVPDIRLVVYKGVPAMAMLRLPTNASDGRANLHTGGIGVGLCVRTGRTLGGIWHNRRIDRHIDTDLPLEGVQLPSWKKILNMAAKAAEMVKLGYVGVDIVLDRQNGPMLLEVNARPGIAIQNANSAGLKTRLEQIDRDIENLKTAAARIAYAAKNFGVL